VSGETGDEIYFEFRRVGASVKVTAIDPKSGKEVSMVGPASAGERALAEAAAKKLRYVLSRR
jgi:hypothetical protein